MRYTPSHWAKLDSLRSRAAVILRSLGDWTQSALVHGSVARGDVDEKSDVDVLIPATTNAQLVETSLERSGFTVTSREIAQATPLHTPKAHLFLDAEQTTSVTVPLVGFRPREQEFYSFGGTVNLAQIRENTRSIGCTKNLLLIEPEPDGHFQSPIVGRESEVARILGVSVSIVVERVRILTRRDSLGRTGMYLRIPVRDNESFDQVLQQQSASDPALRRTLRNRAEKVI